MLDKPPRVLAIRATDGQDRHRGLHAIAAARSVRRVMLEIGVQDLGLLQVHEGEREAETAECIAPPRLIRRLLEAQTHSGPRHRAKRGKISGSEIDAATDAVPEAYPGSRVY